MSAGTSVKPESRTMPPTAATGTTGIAKRPAITSLTFGFRPDVVELTKLINPDLTPQELATFLYEAFRLKLDPASGKQIYAVVYSKNDPSKRKLSIQIAVDGLRAIAAASGLYDGNGLVVDGPLVTTDGVEHPEWCEATIYRRGAKHPFVARVRWTERVKKEKYGPSAGKLTDFWREQPFAQLEKCAEAAALRKAFPLQMRGVELSGEAPDEHSEAIEAEFHAVDESQSSAPAGAHTQLREGASGEAQPTRPSGPEGHRQTSEDTPSEPASEDPAIPELAKEISDVIREDSGEEWSKRQYACFRERFHDYTKTYTGIFSVQEVRDVPWLETLLADLKAYRH